MRKPHALGRVIAVSMIALAAIALVQALLNANLVRSVYARPATVMPARLGSMPAGAPEKTGATFWEAFPPGANDPVVAPGRHVVNVPIFMYHYIQEPPDQRADPIGYGLSVRPEEFRRQMDYLDEHGYHPVTLADLRAYLQGQASLPDKPVVLTFDDGYIDFYTTAFPILREHRFRAVAYIVSGFTGTSDRYMTPAQVREIDAAGIEIGAHTYSHVDLTQAGVDLNQQLIQSKTQLEAIVGHPVVDFCYPSGRFNAAVVAAVQAAGYQSATTTVEGTAHSFDDRYQWTRVRMSPDVSITVFAADLANHENGVAPARVAPIRIPRAFPLVLASIQSSEIQ